MASFQILAAKETLFFSNFQKTLRQWIEVTIESQVDEEVDAIVTIRAGGEAVQTVLALEPGVNQARCYAPVLWPLHPPEERAILRLNVRGATVESSCPVGHHRPWVVYVLSDVCTDTTWVYDRFDALRKDDADLTAAELALAQATRGAPEPNHNHYNLVHALELEYFAEFYPEKVDQLAEAMRRGEITLNPFYNMTLTLNLSLEEQIRLFYQAREWALRHQIPMHYANHQETPSIAWDMAGILAGCGVDYLVKGILPYECPWAARLEEPPVFAWEGPDGSRVKVRRRNADYVEGRFLLGGLDEANRGLHERVIPEYEAWGERYPFSAIGMVGCYGDLIPAREGRLQSRDFPLLKASVVARYNDQGWEYPRLVNAAHAQFWNELEKQIATRGIVLETVRGDYGAGWDIWPACLAHDAAAWRRAQERSALADKLAAILSQLDPAWWRENRAQLAAAWKSLKMLADHAWNGDNDANRALNASLRREWQTQANAGFDRVIAAGLTALAARVPGDGDGARILAFNGLPWPRDGLVRVQGEAVSLLDPRSGEELPAQRDAQSGDWLFLARDLPPLGYRAYRLREGTASAAGEGLWRFGENRLEGPFYIIEVSPVTGGIVRLYDKTLNRELVDAASPYHLNQCLYFSAEEIDPNHAYPLLHAPVSGAGIEHTPLSARVEPGQAGPLSASLVVTTALAEMQLKTTFTLYAHLDRLDITNELVKPPSDRREQVDFAFPFHVPGRKFRLEYPGVILDPEREMRPGAGLSAAVVRHFVDVFNPEHGVTLALLDSFAVQFGRRTTTEDPQSLDASATLLALALGNIYDANEAIRRQGEVERFTFRFSLRGHAGGFNPVDALRFAWESCNPIEAVPAQAAPGAALPAGEHAFVRVEPQTAILTTLKVAEEEGLIARVWDCAGSGQPARLSLSLPQPPAGAFLTDPLERDQQPLQTGAGAVEVPLKARGLSTARFIW